jgi:glutathione S-transferase
MERELAHERGLLVEDRPTLADFFMLPTLTSLSLTPEGPGLLATRPRILAWLARMNALPSVAQVRAMVAPHIGKPVEHARSWVGEHRRRY